MVLNRLTGRAAQVLRHSVKEPWVMDTCRVFSAAPQPADNTMEVKVNGKSVTILKGSTVMQACDAAGVDIPR